MKLIALATLAASIFAVPASAMVYDFSVVSTVQANGNSDYIPDYQFSIDTATESNPADFFSNDYAFTFFDVPTTGQRPTIDSPDGDESYLSELTFFPAATGGAFTDNGPNSYFGQQLYTGTTANPKFLTGTFNLFDADPTGSPDAVVTITAAVPEPASWALMIAGFGVVGRSMRNSRSRSAKRSGMALA